MRWASWSRLPLSIVGVVLFRLAQGQVVSPLEQTLLNSGRLLNPVFQLGNPEQFEIRSEEILFEFPTLRPTDQLPDVGRSFLVIPSSPFFLEGVASWPSGVSAVLPPFESSFPQTVNPFFFPKFTAGRGATVGQVGAAIIPAPPPTLPTYLIVPPAAPFPPSTEFTPSVNFPSY
jgi:hypothetical protein